MKLFDHQQKIIDEDPKKSGIFLGTGGGKTLTCLSLARGLTLVVCPKTVRDDQVWQKELSRIAEHHTYDICLNVVSKEEFRAMAAGLQRFDTVIFDEAHTICGVTPGVKWKNRRPVPATSQIYEAAVEYLARTKPERLYLATATPMRSPMAVYALGNLLGHPVDFFTHRATFYSRLPVPGREIWKPRTDPTSKTQLADLVRSMGYVGRLEDWFDVPDQIEKVEHLALTAEQKKRLKALPVEFSVPLTLVGKWDQVENGVLSSDGYSEPEIIPCAKVDRIVEYAEEFPKLLVFAKYTLQVKAIAAALKKAGVPALELTGATKDRGALIEEARRSERCAVVAQSQISSGYGLPDFPCIIFASLSGSLVDLEQAKGRVQRADNIKKNVYVYLVTKPELTLERTDESTGKKKKRLMGVDDSRYRANMKKVEFSEELFSKEII